MSSDAAWLIDQLVCQGVTKFCIAPGSRSAPLAMAAVEHPKADCTVHFDERGLGFFAVGYGKGAKKPAAVIVTSGTAVGNLMPAMMEAFHSNTPLLFLTADRPHELRACGANQTTDQVKFFANFTRLQIDLAPNLDEKTIRSVAAQAVFENGPVHLNCPFREPLYTQPPVVLSGQKIHFSHPKLTCEPVTVNARRGIILLGSVPNPEPVLRLAKRLQWPVFADLLSNARCTPTPEQIRHLPTSLPDFVLHVGGPFISKHILNWAPGIPWMHVSPNRSLQDPSRRITHRIQSDIEPFCASFQAARDPTYLAELQQLDQEKIAQIASHFAESPYTESHAIRSLPSHMPIFIGNSMPIRIADRFFFPPSCRPFFANRGVSGIDGNIATAAGIADALKTPILAFLGDQTTLHDLNSLALLKKYPVLLVISNNFGGAIFDYLPSNTSPHLNSVFAAAHAWNFEGAAKMFDIPYIKTSDLTNLPSSGIVELITDRKTNHQFYEHVLANKTTALGIDR